MNYVGLKCPVCGKAFSAEDDIVVCPQCGAPYHRDCYAHEGKCIYSDRHGTPDAWQPPQSAQPQDGSEEQIKRCPQCGAPNAKDSIFCKHCGLPLSSESQPPYTNPFPEQKPEQQDGFPPTGNGFPPQPGVPGQPFPFAFDPLGGVDPAEPIDDIPAGDVAKFVQGNTQYYLPVFMNTKHFGRTRFNFSAFFFQGVWMLYRKQYKIGALITSIQAALLILQLFATKYFCYPIMMKVYNAVGISLNDYGNYTITPEQSQELLRQLVSLPTRQSFLAMSPLIFSFAGFVLMLICGFIGNRLYMKHCVDSIHKIKNETTSPTEFSIRLQQNGGVQLALAAGLILCFLIILFFTQF